MSKKGWLTFDAAGWPFYTVLTLVLVGPCIWLTTLVFDPKAGRWQFVLTGIVAAAIGAGCVSSVVNWVLQRRQKKQRIARRKQAKKQR